MKSVVPFVDKEEQMESVSFADVVINQIDSGNLTRRDLKVIGEMALAHLEHMGPVVLNRTEMAMIEAKDDFILAVKTVRNRAGIGLLEAKNLCDAYRNEFNRLHGSEEL